MNRIINLDEYYLKIGIVVCGTLFYCYKLMEISNLLLKVLQVIAIGLVFIVLFMKKEDSGNRIIFVFIGGFGLLTVLLTSHAVVTIKILSAIAIEVVLLPFCDSRKNEGQLRRELNTIASFFVVFSVIVAILSFGTYILGISKQFTVPSVLGDTILFLGMDWSSNALIGIYSNANAASVLYVVAIGFVLYFAQKSKYKIPFIALAAFMIIMLYLTDSRGGILGLGVILVFWFFSICRGHMLINSTKILFALYVLVLFIIALSAFYYGIGRNLITAETGGLDSSTSARVSLWKAGIEISTSHLLTFLFGVGGHFKDIVAHYIDPNVPKVLYSNMHNIYMQTLVTFGITGLICFLVLLCRMILGNLIIVLGSYEKNRDLIPLIGIIAAVAIISLVESDFYMGKTFQCTIVWILAGYIRHICLLSNRDTQG